MFIDEFWPKYLDIITANRQTICVESVNTIAIPLVDGLSIKLERVIYISKYNLNLISLGQLQNNKVTYIDNTYAIILI